MPTLLSYCEQEREGMVIRKKTSATLRRKKKI